MNQRKLQRTTSRRFLLESNVIVKKNRIIKNSKKISVWKVSKKSRLCHDSYNVSLTFLIVFVLNISHSMNHIDNLELTCICLFMTDELSPEVVYCPADQSITTTSLKTEVTWKEPQFKDNSNDPLTIKCSHQSGTEFYWGTWNVHCTAQDNNPNNEPALCQFTLTIKRK